jgi:myosin-5
VKEDNSETVATLRKEVASLREQMTRLVAGKYRTDRSTEKFLNNDSAAKASEESTAGAAARLGMSFFESAAQVTARVAGTLQNAATGSHGPLSNFQGSTNLRQKQVEIEEDSEPKARPVRMLEARDLEDEVIESLITNLRIPLPSTQAVASKKEIFFPAHLLGYLISQFLEYKLVDRMREMLGSTMNGIHI